MGGFMTQAWDQYWQDHHASNSFGCDYTENTGPYGTVNRFWLDCFATLKATDIVMDVGCGNGALAKLFLDSQVQSACQLWHSVDLAKVKFAFDHPAFSFTQADMTALPFADNSVDVCVSMFGLEYANLVDVFSELTRVQTSQQRLYAMLHHSDSVITRQSKVTHRVSEQMLSGSLFADLGVYAALNHQQLGQQLLQRLQTHLHAAEPIEVDEVKLIGQAIFQILQSSSDSGECVTRLSQLVTQMQAQQTRLEQQILAAEQAEQLPQVLECLNLTCYKYDVLQYHNDIIGWIVTPSK
jgi:ubiquinone/menaquinone biosynthesis C-methylase UbiE